ncbi:hypothetical protein PL81_23145, partial [Streptomyces sp. RSD-27]
IPVAFVVPVLVACVPGRSIPWQAPLQVHVPEEDTPFVGSERLAASANASATDPPLGRYVTVGTDTWVRLR